MNDRNMVRDRVKKMSFQESLEEIKEKMKEKRNKRLASVSAPNRGRSRLITKCNAGVSSTNMILKGIQQNNQALAVALQAEKERVRQANAVILQLKRERQALFLHLLLLKKKLEFQEALAANSSEKSSSNNILPIQAESQRKQFNKSIVDTPPQKDSPLFAEGKPARLPSTVGVRRRQRDQSSSSRRCSGRVQELKMISEGSGACSEALVASPICSENENPKQKRQSVWLLEEPDEEFQHSTPELALAKSTKQPPPGRKPQTRARAEVTQKKPDRGCKAQRVPLKKPWENTKPRARSKSRDRSKTASAPQNKLNTSLGFNDTFDFDCEEAVHVTPFKAKAEDEEPETVLCNEPPDESPVVSIVRDSLSQPSSESEDSLYVPQKNWKKQASPERAKGMNTRRGRPSQKVEGNNENASPQKEFNVYRDEDSSPTLKKSSAEEIVEWKSLEKGIINIETDNQEVDIEEHHLSLVSPLVEAEIKRIDDVLLNFGETYNENSPLLTDQTPQRTTSCKRRGLGVRPVGRGLSLCDVTNLSPAAYRTIPRGGSRLSDVRCSTPAQGPGRKRRCTMTVNYKEPSLNAKLRRGDKFTDVEFLSSPIFKQKSGRKSIQNSRSSMKMQQSFEKYNESFVGCR